MFSISAHRRVFPTVFDHIHQLLGDHVMAEPLILSELKKKKRNLCWKANVCHIRDCDLHLGSCHGSLWERTCSKEVHGVLWRRSKMIALRFLLRMVCNKRTVSVDTMETESSGLMWGTRTTTETSVWGARQLFQSTWISFSQIVWLIPSIFHTRIQRF